MATVNNSLFAPSCCHQEMKTFSDLISYRYRIISFLHKESTRVPHTPTKQIIPGWRVPNLYLRRRSISRWQHAPYSLCRLVKHEEAGQILGKEIFMKIPIFGETKKWQGPEQQCLNVSVMMEREFSLHSYQLWFFLHCYGKSFFLKKKGVNTWLFLPILLHFSQRKHRNDYLVLGNFFTKVGIRLPSTEQITFYVGNSGNLIAAREAHFEKATRFYSLSGHVSQDLFQDLSFCQDPIRCQRHWSRVSLSIAETNKQGDNI